MKKILFVLCCMAFISANAQTADEVIQKYAAKHGGLAAFNKIKTAKSVGTLSTGGYDLPITVQIVSGKGQRTDVEASGKTITTVYYNGTGWKVNPLAGINTPVAVTGAELNDYKGGSVITPALMNYKVLGHKIELLGQEVVEGINTYKIKFTAKDDGKTTLYFISATDYSIIKTETEKDMQGKKVALETWFSNLKEINGVKFYFTKSQKMDGQLFQTIQFATIETNVTIDEKVFEMPK